MLNDKKIEDIKNRIIRDFWEIDSLKISSSMLLEYYKTNYDKSLENACSFRTANIVETTIYFAEILKSNFALKFLLDSYSLAKLDVNNMSLDECVRRLKSIFENSYHIFSFITFNLPESKREYSELYKYWYHPNKAKEFVTEVSDTPWAIDNESVSGKLWTLKNCPIFKFYNGDIAIIRDIKNADSHEKLIFRKDEILVLLNNQIIKISEKQIKELTRYLIDCVLISVHFFLSLFIRKNFWTTPILLLANSERFKNKYVPFDILKNEEEKETKKEKVNKTSNLEAYEDIPVIFMMLVEFAIKELWDMLLNDNENINSFLEPEGIKLDTSMVLKLKETSMLDFLNIISIATYKMKQLILKEEAEVVTNSKENLNKIFEDFEQTSRRILAKKDSENIYSILVFLFIIWGYGMLKPLRNLKDNFQNIIVKL